MGQICLWSALASLLVWLVPIGICGVPFDRILERAGPHRGLIALVAIPFVGILAMLSVLAFRLGLTSPRDIADAIYPSDSVRLFGDLHVAYLPQEWGSFPAIGLLTPSCPYLNFPTFPALLWYLPAKWPRWIDDGEFA